MYVSETHSIPYLTGRRLTYLHIFQLEEEEASVIHVIRPQLKTFDILKALPVMTS